MTDLNTSKHNFWQLMLLLSLSLFGCMGDYGGPLPFQEEEAAHQASTVAQGNFPITQKTSSGAELHFSYFEGQGLQVSYQEQGSEEECPVLEYPLLSDASGNSYSLRALSQEQAHHLAQAGKWEVTAGGKLRYLGMRGEGGMRSDEEREFLEMNEGEEREDRVPTQPSTRQAFRILGQAVNELFREFGIRVGEEMRRGYRRCCPRRIKVKTPSKTQLTFTYEEDGEGLQAQYQTEEMKSPKAVEKYPELPRSDGEAKRFSQLEREEAYLLVESGKWEVNEEGELRYEGERLKGYIQPAKDER